ncbi:MAG: tetratricopeptide repeat protein [Acidobacteria bacterium]|nr:tetratricopeptide repeat protein [Acidobacteriota bacterium]
MKKYERHLIKRDELVTVFEKSSLYIEQHARKIALLGGGVALLAIGGFALRSSMAAREERASFLLAQIVEAHRAPVAASLESLQQAAPGTKTYTTEEERDRKVLELVDELLSQYASSPSAPKALYYKGLALSGLKKPEEAAQVLQDLVTRHPGDFLAPMARYQLGRLREQEGNASEALIQYQALAEDAQGFFPKEEGLMGVARCQEALGRKDEAIRTYRKIVSDFPESDYQFEARQKIEELS